MNFREKAASFILCTDDPERNLKLLDSAKDESRPDEVHVWEKFEYEPVSRLLEYINTIENMLQEAYNLGLEQNRKLMGKYEKEQVMIRSMYKSIKDLN